MRLPTPHSRFLRVVLSVTLLFSTTLFFTSAWCEVRVTKTFTDVLGATVTDVQEGDRFTVDITVRGDDQQDPSQVLPFDAVLMIDQSSSMLGSKMDNAKAAAKRFIELTKAQSDSTGVNHRIGIIIFTGDINDDSTGLSSDYDNLLGVVDDVSTDILGSTSIYQPMVAAHLLFPDDQRVRICILLTDGQPSHPGEISSIQNQAIPQANDLGIRYFTVGVGGGTNEHLLQLIAGIGGNYIEVPDETELAEVYNDIFHEITTRSVAAMVELDEQVNTDQFTIVPDSWTWSRGEIAPRPTVMEEFRISGHLRHMLGTMLSENTVTFSFDVQTKACPSPPGQDGWSVVAPNISTNVSYRFGGAPGRVTAFQNQVNCHPCNLVVLKDYNPGSKETVLTVKSCLARHPVVDNTIHDVRIFEFPSVQYQYRAQTASPMLTGFIPDKRYDLLYWTIPKLTPLESRTFYFRSDFIGWYPRDVNPMFLNERDKDEGESSSFVTYRMPDGERGTEFIPQRRRNESVVENLPEGRPDYFIDPPWNLEEVKSGIPRQNTNDEKTLSLLAGDLPGHWPIDNPLFLGEESVDVWIDSAKNGFVSRWGPSTSPSLRRHIVTHIDNAVFDRLHGYFRYIKSQGDLFYRNFANRVYIRIRNQNAFIPIRSFNAKLEARNSVTSEWQQIATIPVSLTGSSQIVYFEIPARSVPAELLRPISRLPSQPGPGPNWEHAWLTELRVRLTGTAPEKHTTNNVTTEKILVVEEH